MKNLKKWRVIGIILVAILMLFAVLAVTPAIDPTSSEAEACGFYHLPYFPWR